MTTSIQTCLPCSGKHSLKMAPSPSLLRHGSTTGRRNSANRRSAVERLEESKANYVKSESVLDSKQEFEHSMHLQVGKASDLGLLKPNWSEVVLRPKSPALPIRARAKSQSEVRDSPTRRRISLFRRNSARSVEATTDLESQLKQLISAEELPHPRLLPPPPTENQKVRRGYSDPVNRHHGNHTSSLQGIHKSMPDLTRRRIPDQPRTISSSSSDSSEDFFRVTPKNSLRCLLKQPPNYRRGGSDTSDDEALRPPPPRPVYVQPPPPPLQVLECYSLRRPVLRSKSDVGYRSLVRKSADVQTRRRNSYSGSDLERFFNMLGLDSSVWHRLTSPAAAEGGSPPRFFESGSSIQSDDYRSSFGSDDSMHREGLLNRQLKEHSPGETSIVEKNARVIKWLYNCRKAQGVLGT